MFGCQKRCSVCLRSDDVDSCYVGCPWCVFPLLCPVLPGTSRARTYRPVFSHCFLALTLLASYPGAGDYSQFQTNQVMPVPTRLLFLVNAKFKSIDPELLFPSLTLDV